MNKIRWIVAVMAFTSIEAGAVPITVSFDPMSTRIVQGQRFSIDLIADLPIPVLAWGLDIGFDSMSIRLDGPPTIGSLWTAVPTADGDGLAGAAFPLPIAGPNVLLAALNFTALTAFTETSLTLDFTVTDLTEGFFAVTPPGRYSDVDLSATANVVVDPRAIPEPSTFSMMLAAVFWMFWSARRR